MRRSKQIEIPARSQTVFHVRVKNELPSGIIGQCHAGRTVQNLGILVANTISTTQKSKVGTEIIVMAMNPSEKYVVLYPRTKIGTFSIISGNDIGLTKFSDFNDLKQDELETRNKASYPYSKQTNKILSKIDIAENLKLNQKAQLETIIHEYSDIFHTKGSKVGYYDKVKHDINTGNNYPVRYRPYKHSPLLQETIRNSVEKMLKDNIISKSTSLFSSRIVMVKKKSGEYRFCVDFRAMNRITEPHFSYQM